MARVSSPTPDGGDGVYCPRCGAAHTVHVVRMPQPNGWFHRLGEAVCDECQIKWPIEGLPSEEQEEEQIEPQRPRRWLRPRR